MGNVLGVALVIVFMLSCLIGVGLMIADKEFEDKNKQERTMNTQFEEELTKLLNKYYSSNWDYVWEFEGETIHTTLWLGEEKE